jgi:hypothetical protein
MGFNHDANNILALDETNGNIQSAIDKLIQMGSSSPTQSNKPPLPQRSPATQSHTMVDSSSPSVQQLRGLGFPDDALNIAALKKANGNLELAVSFLTDRRDELVSSPVTTSSPARNPQTSSSNHNGGPAKSAPSPPKNDLLDLLNDGSDPFNSNPMPPATSQGHPFFGSPNQGTQNVLPINASPFGEGFTQIPPSGVSNSNSFGNPAVPQSSQNIFGGPGQPLSAQQTNKIDILSLYSQNAARNSNPFGGASQFQQQGFGFNNQMQQQQQQQALFPSQNQAPQLANAMHTGAVFQQQMAPQAATPQFMQPMAANPFSSNSVNSNPFSMPSMQGGMPSNPMNSMIPGHGAQSQNSFGAPSQNNNDIFSGSFAQTTQSNYTLAPAVCLFRVANYLFQECSPLLALLLKIEPAPLSRL